MPLGLIEAMLQDGSVRLGDQDLRELLVRTAAYLQVIRGEGVAAASFDHELNKLIADLGKAINELNKLRR